MLIAWDNAADDGILATDSEIANLPASNTQHPHVAQKWHTVGGVKSAYLIWDLVTSRAISVLAVLGANLTDQGTFRLRASDSDSSVTSSLAYDSGTLGTGIVDGYGAIYHVLSEVSARYWRLDLADSYVASNLQVGRVFLGPSWTPAVGQSLGWSMVSSDPSVSSRTRGGQLHWDERDQIRVARFSLDFMSESEAYSYAFVAQRANGRVRDVLAINDPSGSFLSQQSIFGLLQASEPIVNDNLGIFRQRFTIEERL